MFGSSAGGTGKGFSFSFNSTTTSTSTLCTTTTTTTKPLFSFSTTFSTPASTLPSESSIFSFGTASKPLFSAAASTTVPTTSTTWGFGTSTTSGTTSLFATKVASATNTSAGSTDFSFGSKSTSTMSGLFGASTTTSAFGVPKTPLVEGSKTTATTVAATAAVVNAVALPFSSSAGFDASQKPFGNLFTSSQPVSSVAVSTTLQSSSGSLFKSAPPMAAPVGFVSSGASSTLSSVASSTAATTTQSLFSFSPSLLNQPATSLPGTGTSQLAPTITSAGLGISMATTGLMGQKATTETFLNKPVAPSFTATSAAGFSFGVPTTEDSAVSGLIFPTIVSTAPLFTSAALTTSSVNTVPLSFGSTVSTSGAISTSGATALSLFGSAAATNVTLPLTGSVTTISNANSSFGGLFGAIPTSSISFLPTLPAASTTTVSGLGGPQFGLLSSSVVTAPVSTPVASFGASALTVQQPSVPLISTIPSSLITTSTTSTTSTVSLLFGGLSSVTPSINTVIPTGFTFGQMATTTAVSSVVSVPVMTSLLSSTTSIASTVTTGSVVSTSSALSSLLFPPVSTTTNLLTTPATTTTTTISITSSSVSVASSAPSVSVANITPDKPISFAQLEQLVNRLALDVESQQRTFMSQVLELNAYDRVLRENQKKVLIADEEIKQLEEEKDRFLHVVDFISQQQTELEALVVELEKSLGLGDWAEMAPIKLPDMGIATHADMERRSILQLQVQIDAQLKQADDDINDIIEQVKELQTASAGADDEAETADQIAQILRRQLDALQWIDEQCNELQSKVVKLTEELSAR